MRIAFLLTCYNRAEKTLECLRSIYAQRRDPDDELFVFLVDDGCTDGTAHRVAGEFPAVKIITGRGNLYWNGGMRVAYAEALSQQFNYFVWINDDTKLLPGSLRMLLDTSTDLEHLGHPHAIVVGATLDPDEGTTSYSGWKRLSRFRPGIFRRVLPETKPVSCDTFNGNCVLIPGDVAQRVGNLDSGFTHSMGDLDYGLRALNLGCSIWVAPGHIGICKQNAGHGLWTDESLGLLQRWHRMLGPKGLPPLEWLLFTRRHHGYLWWLYWINPYVKFWLKGLWRIMRPMG